jgi:ADP-ribosylglycohydrolase
LDSKIPDFEIFTDRFKGAVIGLMAGDALGMPIEGRSRISIREQYGVLNKMIDGRFKAGSYTDDFQMALGLLESLNNNNGLNPQHLADTWQRKFDPVRGYGNRIGAIMARIKNGDPWDEVGTDSYGNGSAMRIGPLGAFFAFRPDILEKAAVDSSIITHKHSQAVAGACVQAVSVAMAVRAGVYSLSIDRKSFLSKLIETAQKYDSDFPRKLMLLENMNPGVPEYVADQLSSLFSCDVRSIEAVPPAIGAFLYSDNLEDTIVAAVSSGGDTDTIGAMAGSIAGGYYGYCSIPEKWTEKLENEPDSGKDYALRISETAAEKAYTDAVGE